MRWNKKIRYDNKPSKACKEGENNRLNILLAWLIVGEAQFNEYLFEFNEIYVTADIHI
jgi:hypothetical protein